MNVTALISVWTMIMGLVRRNRTNSAGGRAESEHDPVPRIAPLSGNWSLIASELPADMRQLMTHYHRTAPALSCLARRATDLTGEKTRKPAVA
jgi:hypothetical protein